MRALLRFLKLFTIAACVVALFFSYFVFVGPWLSLKTLERQVKKNVDPTELRSWAMNLIAEHSGEIDHWEQFYGAKLETTTNIPAGLKMIGNFREGINVYTHKDYVAIFDDRKGGPFLKVGPPTLPIPSDRAVVQWKPGIYFIGR